MIQPDGSKIDVEIKAPSWGFDNGLQGWTLNSSLRGTVSKGILYLEVIGEDPFMVSPKNLRISAASYNQLEITLQNGSMVPRLQLFWITTKDDKWHPDKSIWFDVCGENSFEKYTVYLQQNSLWKGTIKQIRLDPGSNINIDKIMLSKIIDFSLNNGTILLKQDLLRGGAISYISKSGTARNIVNIHDEGRYIQQSYYAGNKVDRLTEEQSPNYTPWQWNPVQVGDYSGKRAKILAYCKLTANSTYVKCIPMQWDMKNQPAEAEMEQWTELNDNIITVRNRLSCFRNDDIYGEEISNYQEVPAVYPISALRNLYSYVGNEPFTSGQVSQLPVVFLSSGDWGHYYDNMVSESWMAFVDNSKWGMGVYSPITRDFNAGMSGEPGKEAASASTSHIAPVKLERFNKNTVYEYTYYLVIGTLDKIRESIYQIHGSSMS